MAASELRRALVSAQRAKDNSEAMLQELHGYVRDMCVYLGADESEIPCDAWTLRDLLIVMKRVQQQPRGPTHVVHGAPESSDSWTACDACQRDTDEGHTHEECYRAGVEDGHRDATIEAAQRLSEALGINYQGEELHEVLAKVPVTT